MHGDDESVLAAHVRTHVRQRQFQNVDGTGVAECLLIVVCTYNRMGMREWNHWNEEPVSINTEAI